MAKKKTSFYHTRNKIAPNKEQAANVLGVDVSEIERMDIEGAPVFAERLLLLWDSKNIGAPGWDGWCFSQGALLYKKIRFKPDNLLNLHRNSERLFQVENDLLRIYSFYGILKIFKFLMLKKFKIFIKHF